MKTKDKEILSSCCAFGSDGSEEVHVLAEECPINRDLGKRKVEPFFKHEQERTECTCVLYSDYSGMVVPPCKYYGGTKKVQRNKRREYKVFCKALDLKEME